MQIQTENTLLRCSDGLDNDKDGLVDLADPDCAAFKPKLTVTKIVDNGAETGLAAGDFPLFVNGTPVTSGVQATFNTAGTYTVTETSQAGYTAQFSGDCNVNGVVTLAAGDVKTCTLTNTKTPTTGTLRVTKVVTNDNGGLATASSFSFQVNGGAATAFETDGSNDITLAPGSYSVTEVTPTGYDVTYSNCTNVTVSTGQVTECTITNNDKPATLHIVKTLINDDGGTAAKSDFSFKVNNGTSTAFESDGTNDIIINANTNYSVVEDEAVGYTTTYNNCTDINIGNGQEATCTITNDDNPPMIRLVKTVVNDNGGSADAVDFQAKIDNTNVAWETDVKVTAGAHTVSEVNLPGYTAGTWGGDCDVDGNVTVALGETKTCTITNDDQPGKLIVTKVVDNNHGGTAVEGDFTFHVTAGLNPSLASFGSGDEVTLNAGSYNVTEDAVHGYQVQSNTCSGTIVNGAITECTITNEDVPATLTIIKQTTGGDGEFGFMIDNGAPIVPPVQTNTGVGQTAEIPLNAGTYNITETTMPTDWDFTSVVCTVNDQTAGTPIDNGATVTVGVGDEVVCTFSDTKRGSITVEKIASPAGSFRFDLTGPNNFTDFHVIASGDSWKFPSLIPGNYFLSEILPDGWTGSQTISCDGDGEGPENDPSGSILSPFALLLDAGEGISCIVNNTQDAVISGKKFEDEDGSGDGVTGSGINGWTITLEQWTADNPDTQEDESGWSQIDSEITAGEGDYSFVVAPGTYRVCEESQVDWTQSYPSTSVGCAYGNGYTFVAEAGMPYNGKDFGNWTTASIAGYAWDDEDGDGIWDEAEVALSGETIYIDANDNNVNDDAVSDVTDVDGKYSFTNLIPNTTYRIRHDVSVGRFVTAPVNGHSYTPTSGQAQAGVEGTEAWNFGSVAGSAITGFKWEDVDGDGIWDEAEGAADDAFQFTIYSVGEGDVLTEIETVGVTAGEFTFEGLVPGTYVISEESLGGWAQTYPANDGSLTIVITEGGSVFTYEDDADISFGNARAATLSGYKFEDRFADGSWGEEDTTIANWTILATPIIGDSGDEDTESGRTQKATTTDGDGLYLFDFIIDDLGWWRISEDNPDFWTQTAPTLGFFEVFIESGSIVEGYDFGNWEWPTLQVLKWQDLDEDGVRDLDDEDVFTDPALQGYPIALGRYDNTQKPEDDSVVPIEIIALELTDADGIATFRLPEGGSYYVFEALRDSWTRTYPNDAQGDTFSIAWADDLTPVDLDTGTYYYFKEGESGALVTQAFTPDSEGMIAIEFGNFDVPQCRDGIDNDDDGKTDFEGGDPGCSGADDDDETDPPPTGGGGGGGNGQIVNSGPSAPGFQTPSGEVLGAVTETPNFGTQCELYLTKFIGLNRNNDSEQVRRLQYVLKNLEGYNVPENGVYGQLTHNAVLAFQAKYGDDILAPWGITSPTGFVYLTTRKKVNEVYCRFTRAFPLTEAEQKIIEAARARSRTAQSSSGAPAPTTTTGGTGSGGQTTPAPVGNGTPATPQTNQPASTQTPTSEEQTAAAAGALEGGSGTEGGFWQKVKSFFGGMFGR